jgi:hypothetical protein
MRQTKAEWEELGECEGLDARFGCAVEGEEDNPIGRHKLCKHLAAGAHGELGALLRLVTATAWMRSLGPYCAMARATAERSAQIDSP